MFDFAVANRQSFLFDMATSMCSAFALLSRKGQHSVSFNLTNNGDVANLLKSIHVIVAMSTDTQGPDLRRLKALHK